MLSLVVMAAVFMAERCPWDGGTTACVPIRYNGDDEICGGNSGGSSGGGGGGPPAATPTPVPPPPPRTWLLLPGCCGLYSEWGTTNHSNGGPDHHDVAPTEHAVDIGAGGCSTCPDVFYYDRSNSVTTVLTHFLTSCSGDAGGGERVEITLTSVAPPGVYQGTVAYRHLTNAIQSGSPVGGSFLGTVNPTTFGGGCSSGPHLHQGIDNSGGSATITHYTGVYGSGANCEGYPYPRPPTPPAAVISSQQAQSDVPCYALSW